MPFTNVIANRELIALQGWGMPKVTILATRVCNFHTSMVRLDLNSIDRPTKLLCPDLVIGRGVLFPIIPRSEPKMTNQVGQLAFCCSWSPISSVGCWDGQPLEST